MRPVTDKGVDAGAAEDVEQIRAALMMHLGNVTEAALTLAIPRRTLDQRIVAYGLEHLRQGKALAGKRTKRRPS